METKKSKVTKVTKFDKKDDYGNTSFAIEFENSDKGYYSTKDENQKKFVTGQEVEYVIEKREGKGGKEYFKIKLPQEQKQGWSGGGKPQQDPKIQMISFSASYTKDLIVAGKVPMGDFNATMDMIYNKMISKL